MPRKPTGVFLYLGLFLVSVSLLGLELVFTRVAKVAFGQGFQFILVSLAILGIGIGAMIVYFFLNSRKYKEKFNETFTIRAILLSSLLYALLIFAPFFVINNVIVDFEGSYTYAKTTLTSIKLLFFFTTFILYLAWGICVSFIFSYYSSSISLLYFANLAGSAFGGLAAIALMNAYGVAKTVSMIYIVSFAAALFFGFHAKIKIRHVAITSLLLAGYLFLAPDVTIVCETRYKNLFSETNSYSQVDTYTVPFPMIRRYWGTDYDISGFSQDDSQPRNIRVYRMVIDCVGGTDFIEYSNDPRADVLLHDARVVPHLLKNYSRVLIIGSGAGVDVVRAVLTNSRVVDGVEINPLIINRVNELVEPEINVYNQKNVNLYVEEARNFISKSDNVYDFIYIPGAKRYGGASIALYAFLENYLFTEEAFEEYFKHLTEDGVIAITDPHWFILRYLQSGMVVMKRLGIDPINKAILVIGEERSLLMFKKNGFTQDEKRIINESALRFKETYEFIDDDDVEYLSANYAKITDDHPFYWNVYTLKNVFNRRLVKFELFSDPKKENFPSLDNFFVLFLSILAVYLIFTIIPFFIKKADTSKNNVMMLILYFSMLGIGFIIVELVLMQKFVLLLGHPTYSMAVVLSSLLLFSGLGSLTTEKMPFKKSYIVVIVCLIFLIMFTYIFSFKILSEVFISKNLIERIIFSAVLAAIPAFFMGMLFPLGIKLTEKLSRNLIPWMWGINGITSTLGGVLSMIVSLFFGFNVALVVGMLAYALGAVAIVKIENT